MLLTQIPSFFKARRDRMMKSYPHSAFLLPSWPEAGRNPDVEHPYRQESAFYYLSGFPEPDSFLAIVPNAGAGGSYKTVLFVRKRNAEREIWEGARYGVERTPGVFGVDESYPIDELETKLAELIKPADRVYYRMGANPHSDSIVNKALEQNRRSFGRSGRGVLPVYDPNEVIGEMRVFKGVEEIAALRRACTVSAETHKQAMRETRVGMNEYEIEALIDYGFRKNGCQRVGYGSIVAGGVGATCLHYRFNNQPLKDGDLLLIDAGGEFDFYTADITRTFPVGKKFSKPQAQLYELVLKAQKSVLEICKPGTLYDEMHERACRVLIEGMLSLGLLSGNADEIYKSGAFKRFYPHGTGHWLGMDVHDVGLYRDGEKSRKLEPGMVFTVEPGIYIQPDDREAPAQFKDIGIRIEDNILITSTGYENLTLGVPKEIAEIEALRS